MFNSLPLAFLKYVTFNFSTQKNVPSFLFSYISIISLVFFKWDQMPVTNNLGCQSHGHFSWWLVAQWFLMQSLDLIQTSLLSCVPIIHSLSLFRFLEQSQILTSFSCSWVSTGQIILLFSVFSSAFSLPSSLWCAEGNYCTESMRFKVWESWNLINQIVSQGFEKYSLRRFVL